MELGRSLNLQPAVDKDHFKNPLRLIKRPNTATMVCISGKVIHHVIG
jgi:hypothetical protein